MAKKVLIVDDSFVMRTLIKDIVSADPELEVVGDAANGQLGLDAAKKFSPDVILLDIEMPVMDGLECLKRLKLISKAKVIIVSSVAQTGSPQALQARRDGAADVIAKPSGAMSLDLADKKGHDIVKAVRMAAGLR
ncbi:MAG: response regulator [Gallionella sp.]|jgi:two-component system chemotaxis response regulator CheB|nr:response regulator [Gallionella sp.]OGS66700.1 MAG: regulator [Gallionellales bacterium GWA2_54_124]